jgi:hypothetical protein
MTDMKPSLLLNSLLATSKAAGMFHCLAGAGTWDGLEACLVGAPALIAGCAAFLSRVEDCMLRSANRVMHAAAGQQLLLHGVTVPLYLPVNLSFVLNGLLAAGGSTKFAL